MRHGGVARADDSIGSMSLVSSLACKIRRIWSTVVAVVAMAVITVFTAAVTAQAKPSGDDPSGYAQRDEVREFIATMAADHDFDATKLARLFAQAQTQNSAIRAMSAPMTAPPKWFEYAPSFLSQERINGGIAFRDRHRALLERAEREYGVPTEVIVAIIGVETFYGRVSGRYRVFDALTTLAFDYPRRAEFFREELKQFLLLTREWNMSPLSPKGSFAGAMGLPQFMPTSFRRYAIDFDNDGRIDLWTNIGDVVGSVANFLSRHGWQKGQPALLPATAEANEAKRAVGEGGLSERREYLAWTAINIAVADPLAVEIDPHWMAALVQLDEADGPKYRLGFNNFYVLTRYNRSRLYASAVWDLAQAIARAETTQQSQASRSAASIVAHPDRATRESPRRAPRSTHRSPRATTRPSAPSRCQPRASCQVRHPTGRTS